MGDDRAKDLIVRYLQQEDELAVLGKEIERSGVDLAVFFVDIAGSTEMKHDTPVSRWLGYVIKFLQVTSSLAAECGGTVVKRIGDELMLTFPAADRGDEFIGKLEAEPELQHYAYKIAADWGTTYHVTFADGTARDPYGTVVDRAARIAKLAGTGTTLASKSFVANLSDLKNYASLGRFSMKGISEPPEIFVRTVHSVDREQYLKQVIALLNSLETTQPRFRYIPRTFSSANFDLQNEYAHPFLARELLTLPLMPYSFEQFIALQQRTPLKAAEFVGHLVEWEAIFMSSTYSRFQKLFHVGINSPDDSFHVAVMTCPEQMAEALNALKKGDRVRIRAVLVGSDSMGPTLDYADIQLAV